MVKVQRSFAKTNLKIPVYCTYGYEITTNRITYVQRASLAMELLKKEDTA